MRIILLMLLFSGFAAQAKAPYVDPKTDAEHFGDPQTLLFWQGESKVAGFRNIDQLMPTRRIEAGDHPYPLPSKGKGLSSFRFNHGGKPLSIDDFFDLGNTVGLIVVKDGEVLHEQYAAGNDEQSRWVSYSISKSVTSMLVGAAIKDGYIESVDEPISNYLPRLRGTVYEDSTIKHILQMASGTQWNEDYADPSSDVNNTPGGVVNLIRYLGGKKRLAPSGTKFNYNTGETNLVGAVLRAAIGNNLSTYLTDKIWIPFGMEYDATWLLEGPRQGELGGCCISATLRDYARIGLFAMQGGMLSDGTEVLAENWMKQSTSPSKGYPGYGYLWWLFDDGLYAGLGIFGQSIFIDPKKNLVIATQSAWSTAVDDEQQQVRQIFLQALVESL
ncbi:MAG: serine hydrolase [Gammaproteobacteria bacterium]|nr:serine hydrolase [Gammaproteobacteria bacterium]